MIGKLRSIVLDAPDIKTLSSFYSALAGLTEKNVDDDWITLTTPGGQRIAFQLAEDHIPPRWPDPAFPQQFHLDWLVPDLAAAVSRAEELGATRLPGGGDTYTVLADPVGHPFCLCQGDVAAITLSDVAIDCPDGRALAPFYAELLGMKVTYEGPEGAAIGAADTTVMFQTVETYTAPRWPDPAYPQQFHLDVEVSDIDEAEPRALALGATRLPGGEESFRGLRRPGRPPVLSGLVSQPVR